MRQTHVGVNTVRFGIAALVLAACTREHRAVPPATTTTTVAATTTTAPGECPIPRRAEPDAARPRYTLTANVDPAAHQVHGELDVAFTPDLFVSELVFRLWPNGPRLARQGSKLTVSNVRLNGAATETTQPNPTTLTIGLGHGLSAGTHLRVAMTWELVLPGLVSDRVAYVGDTMRLGSFFPILAWEPGVGWGTDAPVDQFAESSVAPTADFDVRVTVPVGFDVLATGVPDASGGSWRAERVRDFAMSIGHFTKATATVGDVVITVGVARGMTDSASAYATKLAAKLEQLVAWFGPYPWPTYTLAITPALRGGIEYPMHVMQGPNTIGRTTTHELAHQWFYGLVGNNQGRDPWLDEGLASYAEARAENALPEFERMTIPIDGQGHLGSPMSYWSGHQPSYYRGVYVQGARVVAALGPPDRVDCALRLYVARNAYRIAKPADFAAAARTVFDTAPAKLAAYGIASGP